MCHGSNYSIEKENRKGRHLSEIDRYKIEWFKKVGMSNRKIAKILNKSHSTIDFEVRRGRVLQLRSDLREDSVYKADYAQMRAKKASKNKGKPLKIGKDIKLAEFLEKKICDEKYSPDAALAEARKGDFTTMICTKTLYTYIENGLLLRLSNKDLLTKKRR